MSYRHRKIDRRYDQPFFSKRKRNNARWVFVLVMLTLIVGLPVIAWLQYDRLQLQALDYLGYAPTATPFASVRANQGEDLYRSGDIDEAVRYFELAVNQQPENVDYLYEYGRLLVDVDRSADAVEIGERMMAIAPDDPRGYAVKANAIAWSDPTVAIPVALEGLEIDDQFSPIHAALAVSYTRIARYREALQRGELAIRLDPMNADARRSYSLPLIYTGNYSEAIRQLQRAIAINPNITGPYFELASLYRNQNINRPEIAVSIFYAILDIEPDNERAYLRLCETYAAAGLFRDAEPFCDAALNINPGYASAHRMRGQLRYSRRNYEGAIEAFEECMALSDDPEIEGYDEVEIECIYIHGLANYFLGGELCAVAWDLLNAALNHPESVDSVQTSILQGLELTRRNCGYSNAVLPTPIPPTPIPPTPIGGY